MITELAVNILNVRSHQLMGNEFVTVLRALCLRDCFLGDEGRGGRKHLTHVPRVCAEARAGCRMWNQKCARLETRACHFITVASGKQDLHVIYCLLFHAINFIIFHVKCVSFRTAEAAPIVFPSSRSLTVLINA